MKKLTGKNSVYLSAPVNALVQGYYKQNTTVAEIKEHGDFGLGTFNNLDG
ncbi:MAG: acetolactate decarboxylase, partial [Elusimicrobiota bacterium]|nr:acetolactate decarboxylase [Elusimicrobiota bacterium]